MTHLAVDVRSTAVDLLDWLLEAAGEETVTCAGGWVKTLKCFLALLGWQSADDTTKWSASKASFGKAGSDGKSLAKNLTVLASFLQVGLKTSFDGDAKNPCNPFPLWHTHYHAPPRQSNCFAHLNLFGALRDAESEMYDDREERQRIYHDRFRKTMERGLEAARREGGEVGRAAVMVIKIVTEEIDVS